MFRNIALAAKRKVASMVVTYELLVEDRSVFADIFDFIGAGPTLWDEHKEAVSGPSWLVRVDLSTKKHTLPVRTYIHHAILGEVQRFCDSEEFCSACMLDGCHYRRGPQHLRYVGDQLEHRSIHPSPARAVDLGSASPTG